jgi:ribosomal protein L11 methyltransferase
VIRLGLRVRPEDTEVAYARLEPLLAAGFEEVPFGDLVELVIYGEEFPDPSFPELVSISRTPVDDGWETAWHEHLEPVTVGAITVRPPWIPGEGLVVDPGVTFGLAAHPTTRLCLQLLQDHARALGLTPGTPPAQTAHGGAGGLTPSTALADWGCGSGVLSVVAAHLGFAPITAIELDPRAVETARANGVDAHVGDVTADRPWARTVVANLTAPLLVLAASAPPAGQPVTMLASGVSAELARVPVDAWEPFGWVERERRELDGWSASILEHP